MTTPRTLDAAGEGRAAGEPAAERLHWKWIVCGIGFGIAFLWLALRQVDFDASFAILRHVVKSWIPAVFLASLWFMAMKTWRWSTILRPVTVAPFNRLHGAVYIGTAANLVIAHTGELIRARMLARSQGVAASAVLATIAIERIFDFVALLVLIALALVLDPRVSPLLWSAGLVSLAFIAIGLVTVVMFLNPTPRLQALGRVLLDCLPERPRVWIREQLGRGVAGLGAIRSPFVVVSLLGQSLLQWAGIVLAIWASAMAVGIVLPASGAIAVFVLTVIGLTLPSSPVQLGTTQLAFVVGFELVAADAANAFAASLVYTCFAVVPMMLIGAGAWALGAGPRRP